jgi:dsRNA-specific ribonuclease
MSVAGEVFGEGTGSLKSSSRDEAAKEALKKLKGN